MSTKKTFRPTVQPLEDRRCMAAALGIDDAAATPEVIYAQIDDAAATPEAINVYVYTRLITPDARDAYFSALG